MKKAGMAAIGTIAVFARLLLCTPVSAPGNPGAGDFNITINGHTSPTYPACDPCPTATGCEPYQSLRCDTINTSECHDYVTGCNVHFISYNATPYIFHSSNTVTVNAAGNQSCPRGKWDGRIHLIALLVAYENASVPEMTYWINEGADILIGGRRSKGGFLSLEECLNHATFCGSINLSEVEKATLGVVSPWAGVSWEPGMTNYLYFNGIELGKGVYCGYNSPCSKTVNGMMMNVGATGAEVGMNVTDVTCYLNTSDNVVIQGDDGDCMMPSNAFLVISRKK